MDLISLYCLFLFVRSCSPTKHGAATSPVAFPYRSHYEYEPAYRCPTYLRGYSSLPKQN